VLQSRAIVATAIASAFQKPRRSTGTGPFWPGLAGIAAGLLVFAVCFIAAKLLLDVWSITEARHLPRWLVDASGRVTSYGKAGTVLWPLAALLLVFLLCSRGAATRRDHLLFGAMSLRPVFLLAAIGLPGLLSSVLKPLIGRGRPYLNGQPDAFFYAPFQYFRELFVGTMPFPEYAYGSMPSGHATTAVASAVAFSALWPRLWPLFWSFALVICATRLTIVVHHPSDVIVGAAIGGLGALAIRNYFAARRWVFAVDSGGKVHAMPGPGLRRLAGAVGRLWRRS
jgi:membrane-associated phospholipid phosphatase